MKDREAFNLPEHLIELPGTKWTLWRWFSLRAAGFPVSGVLKLAAPDCAVAADHLLALESAAELEWQDALAALRSEMDEADGEKRARLSKALKQLKKGKAPKPFEMTNSTTVALANFENACDRVDAASDEYKRQFETALAGITTNVREVVSDPQFREAVIWQNRQVLHTGMDALLPLEPNGEIKRDKLLRKREMLVANYWQRYCVKNDTIGFFGPVGWAKFVSEGAPLGVRPGENLLAVRNVYFDGWCLDALAETLNQERALLAWMTPRRVPAAHLAGATLYLPMRGPMSLSAEEAAALRLCDGERTAKQIASEIRDNSPDESSDEQEVYRILGRLQDLGVVSWQVEAPWTMRVPEEWRVELNLRRALERVEDESLRSSSLAAMAELEQAREDVARAAGDPEELDRSLSELETTFTRLTGAASTRSAGKMYAGRTLVYEDCRRDIELEIGPEILAALAPPLSLLLSSARWFTYQVACEYERAFEELYRALASREGHSEVDFVSFSTQAQPLIYGDKKSLVDNVLRRMQEHWLEILSLPEDESRVERHSESLRSRVSTVFDAPHSGWQYARYHSPDAMIAAESVEAIKRGDYQLVMGEFHVGTNTLGNALFVSQHPRPQEIFTALESDLDAPRLVPVPPKYRLTSRDYTLFTSPRDYRLEFVNEPSGVPRERALPIGSLVVVKSEGGALELQTRDGKLRFKLMEAFADALSDKVSNSFKILPAGRHVPRVRIDRLVVSRESWSFSPTEMEFASEKDEATRYLEARRWAQQYEIPRFVFFKSQFEVKPIYVDFASPLLINVLSKLVRQTHEACLAAERDPEHLLITLTEMYPTPDLVWLPDAAGQRYTSELRMVALDPLQVPSDFN
jgi:hypothetical protein